VAGLDEVTKMQYADMETWLVDDILVKADRMSMAASLELRVPFLDKEMFKVALAIPSRFRVTKTQTKVALRGAAARQLPQRNADMRKLGFPVPLNDWLKEDRYYTQIHDVFTSAEAAEFFDVPRIVKLLDDHKAGHAKNMRKIWSVYCFLVWYRRYFIEETGPVPSASAR
jgi:asparagine synthase (glutamine-hydrolysing)